jgi:hypothetical protein
VEIANIMKDFYEPGHLSPRGLFLGPMKYMVIRGEPLLKIIQGQPGAVIRRGKKVTAQSPLVFVKKKNPIPNSAVQYYKEHFQGN